MTRLISRITFGFIMAQLFPGAVAVFSLSAPWDAGKCGQLDSLSKILERVDAIWFESSIRIVVFLFLAVGTGMVIHGIHWTVWARLENRGGGEVKPVRDIWYHRCWLPIQLFYAPVIMVGELVYLMFAPQTECLVMEENTPEVTQDFFPAYSFLQEFYLYFGQFYAHTAYAILVAIPCFTYVWFRTGWTPSRSLELCGLYIACSVFFLLGRVQLSTLFKAERRIAERSRFSSRSRPGVRRVVI